MFVNNPTSPARFAQIAEGGRDAFYKGDIARRIVDGSTSSAGRVTMEDLAYQHSDWVEPYQHYL